MVKLTKPPAAARQYGDYYSFGETHMFFTAFIIFALTISFIVSIKMAVEKHFGTMLVNIIMFTILLTAVIDKYLITLLGTLH
jgi:hypothetical protein